MLHDNTEVCKAHSGLVKEISDVKWIIGILVVIAMAAVAFLWHTNQSNTDKLATTLEMIQKNDDSYRERIAEKIDSIIINIEKQRKRSESKLGNGD